MADTNWDLPPSMFAQAQVGSIQDSQFYIVQGGVTILQQAAEPPLTIARTTAQLGELVGKSKASEFAKIHSEVLNLKTEGTGNWFRERRAVQEWEAGGIRVLWIRGGPGTGKTYMASSFIQWSKEISAQEPPGTTAVVYVYARYDQKLTEYCVIVAILFQLIWASHKLPTVLSKVHQALQEYSQSRSRPPLNHLIALVKDIAKDFRSIRLIFDGMDEMLRELQYRIAQIFAQVPARIVFLARPSEQLEEAIQEEFTRYGSAVSFIDLVAGDQDINLFVRASIHETLHLRALLRKRDKIEEVIWAIILKAKGMFLHAALQMEKLKRCFNIRDINRALEEFPTKIEDLYHQTLKRIYDEENGFLAFQLFAWLFHIRNSITINDLRYAVSASPDTYQLDEDELLDEDYLLSLCCGLIVVESTTQQVRFVHYSAYEVVLNLLQTKFGLNEVLGNHESIVRTCIARLEDCGFKKSEWSTLGHLRAAFAANPLLEYAFRNASYHLRQALSSNPGLKADVESFVLECTSFPYQPNIQTHDEDEDPLCLLAPLHVATFFGLTDLVFDFLKVQKVHVDLRSACTTGLGWTSLMIAAVEGHEDVLELVLSLEPNVNMVDERGDNVLHEPAYMGNVAVVKALCRVRGIAINQQNKDGNSPLLLAAREGHLEVVKILISVPSVDINLVNEYGSTALGMASKNGHKDVVIALLACRDIKANLFKKGGSSPLALASTKGHLEIVKALLAHPGTIETSRHAKARDTPLLLAARHGHTDVISALLGHPDVDANAVDRVGHTALHLASKRGDLGAVVVLLSAPSTKVNPSDKHQDTPLHLAAERGHIGVMKVLLDHPKINLRRKNEMGRTALCAAAVHGRADAVALLLSKGGAVDVNVCDKWKNSPLHLATSGSLDKIVEMLLACPQIDVNRLDGVGNTALDLARAGNFSKIVQMLLDHPDIDTSIVGRTDQAALEYAARFVIHRR